MTSGATSRTAGAIAVAIHAFYPDILDEILDLLEGVPEHLKYFVTTTKEHEKRAMFALHASGRDFCLLVVENRGRDILPFLTICQRIKEDGIQFVLKLHTKRSPQFKMRDEWRQDVLHKLLSPGAFARAWEMMRDDQSLGILCPEGYYLPLSTHMGPNRSRVLSIGAQLGLGEAEILRQGFVAGSMFMARMEALEPLLNLGFHAADFEPEAGQIDGTFAHVLERCIGLGPFIVGQRISFASSPEKPAAFNTNREFARARWPKSGLWSWPILQNLRYAGRSLETSVRYFVRNKSR